MAIATPDKTYVRAEEITMPTVGLTTFLCDASAASTIGGAIAVNWTVATSIPVQPFATALSNLLQNDLKMATLVNKSSSVEGLEAPYVMLSATAGLRESNILGREWRESIDFDMNIWRDESSVKVAFKTKPLVSRRAEGDRVRYHGTTDAQNDAYAKAYDEKIRDALMSVCSSSRLVDARTIDCNP